VKYRLPGRATVGKLKNGDVVVPDTGARRTLLDKIVVPDPAARVTLLDKNNQVIEQLGDDSASERRKLRTQPRGVQAGQIAAPHGACLDHSGNIFVVEWVEVSRVCKLRKV
jgi:hypothetical protein